MSVKIVTDSVADLPPEVANELGITVIPLAVCFGEGVYRDGIDLTAEECYVITAAVFKGFGIL